MFRTFSLARGTRRVCVAMSIAMLAALHSVGSAQDIVVAGETVYTMAGTPIKDGLVLVKDGKIAFVGEARSAPRPPDGARVLNAKVVTPGLIDAHTVVGLSGIYNQPHDQDQLERSTPIQPDLRAIDAYNSKEPLVEWVRSFGVTTVHTGHAPGELISGQTIIVKTAGETVEDALVKDRAALAVTLGPQGTKQEKGQSPGSRAKSVAMLREQLVKAGEYATKREKAAEDKKPDRDLKLDVLADVLRGEVPLLVTVNKAQDIDAVLRVAAEFKIKVILDSAADGYLLADQIKASGFPVIVHPPMMRAYGEMENMTFELASRLKKAGIPIALQSGYESYVPKTRVVLLEAAIAAANGLSFDEALATITIDAARILGVANRVGSLEAGKDGDLALYDGDPFEYTSHCTHVVINGRVVSEKPR